LLAKQSTKMRNASYQNHLTLNGFAGFWKRSLWKI
jgi:hypothetical protein